VISRNRAIYASKGTISTRKGIHSFVRDANKIARHARINTNAHNVR